MQNEKARMTVSGKNADVKAFLEDLGSTYNPATKFDVIANAMTNPIFVELVTSNYKVNVRGGYYEA